MEAVISWSLVTYLAVTAGIAVFDWLFREEERRP